ncbi:MAG: hypothetical protein ACLPKE_12035 [Streptosporangiaceae bacterium]
MTEFSSDLLSALGRVVINSAGLEAALGVLAGERLDLNAMDVLGRPGVALKEARRATETMNQDAQILFTAAIDEAETLLRYRHKLIHAMWVQSDEENLPEPVVIHMRTFEHIAVMAEGIDQFAHDLEKCRNRLIGLLTSLINHMPLDTKWK